MLRTIVWQVEYVGGYGGLLILDRGTTRPTEPNIVYVTPSGHTLLASTAIYFILYHQGHATDYLGGLRC